MRHRVTPQAQSDIDEIAYYVFVDSGNVETAERLIDSLTSRFLLLAEYPHAGRQRDHDLRPGVRTFPVGEYVIAYRLDGDNVLVLRVLRGSRDIEAILREQ
jgi:toxin ParE1/3/4